MRRSVHRKKAVALLAAGAMLFQFGGCLSLGGAWRNFQLGFSRQIGALPAQAVFDLTIGPLIDGVLAGGNANAG